MTSVPDRRRATASGATDEPRDTISVVVPSYRRAGDLARCLEAVHGQTAAPTEVVVVLRPDDAEGHSAASASPCHVRVVHVSHPGQVAALNRGCEEAVGSIIAFTDDDAQPDQNWVARIRHHFAADPTVGAVGGRDVVYWRGEIVGGTAAAVGRVRWWGKRLGNHHLESHFQDVDFLKGANMAVRDTARAPFEERLRGEGPQVCNDFEASWSIRKRGWRVVWDPDVRVDHFPAERESDDKREARSLVAECDECHNEMYTLLRHTESWQRPLVIAYQLLFGSRRAPGLLLGLRQARDRESRRRTVALAEARGAALHTIRASRNAVA